MGNMHGLTMKKSHINFRILQNSSVLQMFCTGGFSYDSITKIFNGASPAVSIM